MRINFIGYKQGTFFPKQTQGPSFLFQNLSSYNVNNQLKGSVKKRALVILRKIDHCQKRSKFLMQFCLGVLNNVLHVFSLKLASFLRYYVCKKHIFPRASSRDLLLIEKPFVSLNDEVTIIH